MIMNVYKPSRTKNGKKVRQRLYRGRYRINGMSRVKDVALGVSDKQVAEQKLRDIVAQAQREAAGLVPPQKMQDAAHTPIEKLLENYLGDLEARGRSQGYVEHIGLRIRKLASECSWSVVADVSASSFEAWRQANSELAAKTLNDYLTAACGFLSWLLKRGFMAMNSLQAVSRVAVNGHETRVRRALTRSEIERLFKTCGNRKAVYMTAYYTGLRRGEICRLRWDDLHLDVVPGYIDASAAITKNSKRAVLPLHKDLHRELLMLAANGAEGEDLVFPEFARNRRLDRWKRDLKAAEIPFLDNMGRRADFHSLRHTSNTHLAEAGVGERVRQEFMRHSDPKLTNCRYVDTSQLAVVSVLNELVPCDDDSQLHSQIDSQNVGSDGHSVSQDVTRREGTNDEVCTDTTGRVVLGARLELARPKKVTRPST